MMENNTITISMAEYKELMEKALCFDILKRTRKDSCYLDDLEKALFKEEVKNNDTV